MQSARSALETLQDHKEQNKVFPDLSVYVLTKERWICVAEFRTLQEAFLIVEAVHKRRGCDIEIRQGRRTIWATRLPQSNPRVIEVPLPR